MVLAGLLNQSGRGMSKREKDKHSGKINTYLSRSTEERPRQT
jgi:hypothetical protein